LNATLRLQAANTAVDGAFNAVLAAEKAGAKVTGLLVQLNVAEGGLAGAENAYRSAVMIFGFGFMLKNDSGWNYLLG